VGKQFLFIAAIAAVLTFAGCDNSVGLLSSVQKEHAQDGSSAFRRAAAQEVAGFGVKVYAVAAGLYSKSLPDGTVWALESVGSAGTAHLCTGLASTSTAVYAAVRSPANAWDGVYRTADGSTWTRLDSTVFSDPVEKLFAFGTDVYAATHGIVSNDDSYSLYRSIDGAAFVQVTAGGSALALDSPIIDMAIDGGGTLWLIASGTIVENSAAVVRSYVYKGSGIAFVQDTGAPSILLSGIAATSGGVVVACEAGSMYLYSGGSWTSNSSWEDTYHLSDLFEVDIPGSSKRLLVGTVPVDYNFTASGYLEMDYAGAPSTLSGYSIVSSTALDTTTNYALTLEDLTVTGFASVSLSATLTRLYATVSPGSTTVAYGLYSNDWDSSALAWSGWISE
jgi:hypothetical protein